MMFRAGAAASLVLAVAATHATEEGLFDDVCRSLEAQDGSSCSMALLQLRMRKTRRKVSQDQDFIIAALSEDDPDHWSYSDTGLWETAFALCGGKMQSPVDIDTSKLEVAESTQSGTTLSQFATYAPVGPSAALKTKNTGHSVQLNGAFGSLSLPDGEYEARQIQFHFPSEHTVDGTASAGEMHIIHQRKGATGTDGLAVVAILLRTALPGATDPQMQKELEFFTSLGFGKRLPGPGAEIQLPEDVIVNLQAAFGPQLAGKFFHYEGSLTAPPCAEDVHWYILQEPAYATRAMVNNFKSLFPSPANSRPTQLLHDRLVVASRIETGLDEFSPDHQASSAEMVLEVEEVEEEEHEEDDAGSQGSRRRAPRWSYRHVNSWEDDYDDCGGDAQSPVNIDTDEVDPGSGTGPKIAELASYNALGGLSLSNTGKVLTLAGAADSAFGILRLPDGQYKAKQVEFHFPSEHTIDGISAAGEIQIVHQKIGSNDTDDMAMVSILLDEAQAAGQPELGFFESLGFGTRLPMPDDSIPLNPGVTVNLAATFGAQLQGSFYHYVGSLTAPPCSETAHWYVMRAPAPVTKAMINNFKSLFPDPANARPVQKLNKRTIIDSEVQVDDAEFDLEEFENLAKSTKSKHWSYKHTDSWEESFPECGGDNQSPVNINTEKAGDKVGTGAKLAELVRYSTVGPFAFLKTANTGQALEVNGDFGVLMLPDGDYTAKQLQFHFPSEHTIDGESAAGELHIVHQRTDAEGTDGLAVIAILLEVAPREAQPELGFFDSLGFGRGSLPEEGEALELPAGLQLNIGGAFSAQLGQPYYHYRGSLTAPPCSETVHWYVLQQAAAVTQEMVDEIKDLFPDHKNNRPVQKLNGRKIGISEIETDPEEFESESDSQEWSYKKPEKWEEEFPNCAGTAQSPINIMTATTATGSGAVLSQSTTYETLGPYAWLKLFNNGHSLELDADFGTLSLPDGDYEAKQLHFHFPSEHQIDGVLAAGEIHVVHQRKGASGTDGLAVIAIMLHDTFSPDPKALNFFNALGFSARLPTEDNELELPVGLTLNLGEVFAPQLAGEFYHYEGSLTAPPCSESVHWYVMQTPAGIGKGMVNNFKSLFPPPANNRPVQPLNGRAVIVSDLATSENEFGAPEPVQVEGEEKKSKKKSKKDRWSYTKPSAWADDNEECGGENQSPIDIDTLAASKYKGDSKPLSNQVQYTPLGPKANLHVDNDGRTILLDGGFGVLTLPDGEYVAKQLRFHFPSEHSVDGVLAAGEMHIVHQLRGAEGTEGLAIVGVLLHEAELLAKTGDLEQELAFFEKLGFGKKLPIEGWELPLPQDFVVDLGTTFAQQLSGNFFHYEGSLTAPPCSETVHWYMLERPAPITQAMVNNFKAQFPDPMNNRPIQDTNGRKVVVNDIATGKKEFGIVLPVEGQDEKGEWTYDNTEQWAAAYPDCAGDAQSPVDIDTFKADGFKGNQPLEDRIHYLPVGPNAGLQVLNNGHAIKIAGQFGTLDLPDGAYAVRQLHFHFPSEHSIDGVLAAGEMQIIHQRVGAQGTDGIAIVSVMLHDAEMLQVDGEGKELGFFSELGFGAVLPQEKQLMDLPVETTIDLGAIFKAQFAGNYYHYGGSLTRPPCTESVHWYVLEQPAPISRSMVNNFKELFPSPMNNRPIQPINDRDVWINRIKTEKCEFGWCPPEEDKTSSKKGKGDDKKSDKKGKSDDKKSDKKGKKSDKKDEKSDKGKKADKKDEVPWTYSSVQKWEKDFPKCGGTQQSPINVRTDKLAAVQGAGAALNSRMAYGAVGPNAGFQFANDGHSMVLDGNWGTLRLPDGDYIAKSLNFHFPSEHAVDGVLAAGEMQIVHQRSDATGTKDLAVISILLRDSDLLGQEGPVGFFDRLGFSSRLPVEGETIILGADTILNIGAIFAPQFAGPYFHYEGSLTTPPCSESVHWYLMQTAAGINKAMVNNFKSLFPSPANNRPIQERNGRAVVQSELAVSADEFS